MRIHILGICGTFMAGLAALAKEMGFEVTGSDEHCYPPMSDQLKALNIPLFAGYDPAVWQTLKPDCIVVGNIIKRGNASIEYILDNKIPFYSGAAWLAEFILKKRTVLAVAGTHGKTTVSSLLAWILSYAGLNPGFLIGGIPENFQISAHLGEGDCFVIEADEYDTAFFDKRSKFIHYLPKIAILNNLEFDHADIFENLKAIKQQFHHLVRTIPGNGALILPSNDANLKDVMEMGVWTPQITFGDSKANWQAKINTPSGRCFEVLKDNKTLGEIKWQLLGQHNIHNALAAIAAATAFGVAPSRSIKAVSEFTGVKRRLELKGVTQQITFYDDFAHHPTAILATLKGLRQTIGKNRLIAILEFGSFTMRTGYHQTTLTPALEQADFILCKQPQWDLKTHLAQLTKPYRAFANNDELIDFSKTLLQPGDHVVVMSNGSFNGIISQIMENL